MRLLLPLLLLASPILAAEPPKPDPFRKENLVAWCIVPSEALEGKEGEAAFYPNITSGESP